MSKAEKKRDELVAIQRDAIIAALTVDDPVSLRTTTTSRILKGKESIVQGVQIINNLTSRSSVSEPELTVRIDYKAAREHADWSGSAIQLQSGSDVITVAHEIAHLVEMRNPKILERCAEFQDYRSKGKPSKKYDRAWTREDKYLDKYAGKFYLRSNTATGQKEVAATEVLSTGLSLLVKDPIKFMKEDSEHFRFTIGILRGIL
jgi:hypothetical protein